MELFECFGENYKFVSTNIGEEYEVIDDFLEDAEDGGERKYFEPLEAVFMHKTKNEMFLVLNCYNYDLETIEDTCQEWERKISCFVNFGTEYRYSLKYLKYNISLIILCKDEKGDIDDKFRFETEKSLKICRKIFLICDEYGIVNEDDKAIIPFYFSPVEKIDDKETEKLDKELENLLPKCDDEILSICNREDLTADDINKMCRWLMENDNN